MKALRLRVMAAALCVLLPVAASGANQLKLGRNNFDWRDAEQELVQFAWAAEVVNEAAADVDVEVAIDLLSDDDQVIHTDTTRATATGGETTRVSREGSLSLDKATDVVSYRFRIEPVDPS